MTFPLLLAAITFLLMVPWGDWTVRELLRRGIGKRIRTDGPSSHLNKAGTATMGGLYILAGISVVVFVLAMAGYTRLLVPLLAMVAFGVLGAYDDLQGLKDVTGVGWLARCQVRVAVAGRLGRGGGDVSQWLGPHRPRPRFGCGF